MDKRALSSHITSRKHEKLAKLHPNTISVTSFFPQKNTNSIIPNPPGLPRKFLLIHCIYI